MNLIATIILTALFFTQPVFLPSGAFGESPPKAEEKAAPQMPFIKEAGELYAGRFPLKKVGSHYVPDLDKKYGPTNKTLDAVTIPGTDIMAGVFFYEYFNENGKEDFQPKGGLLINNNIYYVESSDNKGWGVFDPNGGAHYGLYKDYFTMDSCASGAVSGCNNRMFLFRYTKDSVELLDVIMATYNLCADFMSVIEPVSYNKKHGPWWTKIADFDNDGNPEIQILISCAFRLEETFKLFLEIKDDKLQIDFNPELYKPLFKGIERKNRNKTEKPDAYYVYGFLSRKLSLKKITAMLAGKEEPGEKEHYIIRILNRRDTWNAGFHRHDKYTPVLIRHNLKNETGEK